LVQSAKNDSISVPATAGSVSIPRNAREETVESEDVLGASLDDEAEESDLTDTDEAESETDEDDVDEGDVGDVEEDDMYDEGDEAGEEEPVESELDSDFEMSASEFEDVSSEEEGPVRRASSRRRTTGSPKKQSSPVKGGATTSAASRKGKKVDHVSPKKVEEAVLQIKAVKGKTPLGESVAQDIVKEIDHTAEDKDEDEDDEEEEVVKPKKKRYESSQHSAKMRF